MTDHHNLLDHVYNLSSMAEFISPRPLNSKTNKQNKWRTINAKEYVGDEGERQA